MIGIFIFESMVNSLQISKLFFSLYKSNPVVIFSIQLIMLLYRVFQMSSDPHTSPLCSTTLSKVWPLFSRPWKTFRSASTTTPLHRFQKSSFTKQKVGLTNKALYPVETQVNFYLLVNFYVGELSPTLVDYINRLWKDSGLKVKKLQFPLYQYQKQFWL